MNSAALLSDTFRRRHPVPSDYLLEIAAALKLWEGDLGNRSN